ncbi:MAG TPA: FkbM family methyltransferase [Puia sp.]|nr:FkbM family methyltransferase [Puia sp.]
MNRLRKILLSILGEEKYLSLLASSFQRLYKTGRLGKSYQDIYFLKSIIREGYCCIDIGAHLGYYTLELSRLAGHSGKVYAIEPVTKFFYTLKNLLKKKHIQNVEVYQLALGGDSEYVEMGIPKVDNVKKFGYARVMQSNMELEYVESERVKNEKGDDLFANLDRLDFIKCDVEGLEVPVFTSMLKTIAKHLPILLCELADKNERIKLYEMLLPLDYKVFFLENKRLYSLNVYADMGTISHNHYFIPLQHRERLKELISQQS